MLVAAPVVEAQTSPGAKPAPAKPPHHATSRARPIECAALTFRGLSTVSAPEGAQIAGLYKTSFGRIDLQARIHGGRPVDYFLTLDGQSLPPLKQVPPRQLWPCLAAKGTALRLSEQHQACAGPRFQIVLTRAAENSVQYLLLYRLAGATPEVRSWHFCRGTALMPAPPAPPPAQQP
jgi:hypothetical protein